MILTHKQFYPHAKKYAVESPGFGIITVYGENHEDAILESKRFFRTIGFNPIELFIKKRFKMKCKRDAAFLSCAYCFTIGCRDFWSWATLSNEDDESLCTPCSQCVSEILMNQRGGANEKID